ncbi:MAG TPA: protein-L-isoaspartate(D-aspartate) O-methyltransferase [Methanoregulaceae archaeon]|nr:protein-L-isoaspartate(D-aspartate) O-methyltransferase [Methanoregulaceae archaeon]HPD75644.1 protein-L-isoaspartate(D-aspartate) O-methyltransferase [Methanoregulaceae archaeon]
MTTKDREDERRRMVELQIKARGIRDPRVLAAMQVVPRHFFIPPPYDRAAYEDSPLPIGSGQTISQPFIVALMTELLELSPADTVLEIGAGSGYQAAVLARIAQHIVTIERVSSVAALAKKNLSGLAIKNVEIIEGDGTLGYPQKAPFDAIIITAATPEIPQPLLDQLKDGGRLVAPVGGREIQELTKIVRAGKTFTRSYHGGVRFVPLIGKHGWEGSSA